MAKRPNRNQTGLLPGTGPKEYTRKVHVPKDTLRWKISKLQILQRKIDDAATENPGNVSIDSYIKLIDKIEELLGELANRNVKSKRMESEVRPGQSPELRQEERPSVDPGVLPPDLTTG